ncbi:MAG: hypothetical protein OXD01_07020 [Gammaproteobacteria bacterium]|nr:hypothetical protein [Gammaproteobacteria bacterium]
MISFPTSPSNAGDSNDTLRFSVFSVYFVISYLTARLSRDPVMAAYQEIT